VDDLYSGSGEFLVAYAAARRARKNVAGVSSTRFGDVLTAARCFTRVTFYGDLEQPVQSLAASLGYKVIEEA